MKGCVQVVCGWCEDRNGYEIVPLRMVAKKDADAQRLAGKVDS